MERRQPSWQRGIGWSKDATVEARLVLEAPNRPLGHRQIEPY